MGWAGRWEGGDIGIPMADTWLINGRNQHSKELSNLKKLTSTQYHVCSGTLNIHFRTYLLVDPSEREERVMDGLLVIAMNKHREICTIQSSGGIMLLKDQVSILIDVPLRIGLIFRSFFLIFV